MLNKRPLIPDTILLLGSWFFFSALNGQTALEGRVIDQETNEPLAFVNIVYNERGTGTTTNLDGYFLIRTDVKPQFLRLSYVGYEPVTIYLADEAATLPLELELKRKPYLIDEVTVRPGINPAHRIIDQAFRHRRMNNPEMLESFSYTSYNKLFFTLVPDSVLSSINLLGSPDVSIRFAFTGVRERESGEENADEFVSTEKTDSGEIRMKEFLEQQHLFLMETVSARKYRRPGRNNEQVVASRVSGFRDPSFSLLATQLQSFTFYEDFISLLDRRYLNPISRGSSSRYSFILEDSLFTGQNDTLFVISFRPYEGRNFDGLQGVVYINSNQYAVQNVIAEPYEPVGLFTIRIRQNYSFIDGRQWFPAELNTDIIFGRESVTTRSETKYSLVGTGKAYLSEIEINPGVERRRFNHVELAISADAHRQKEEFWDKYRVEPLSAKDRKTYHVIDSIGEEVNFDRTLKIFEAFATGFIPWGSIDIDYRSLLDYNSFEGVRTGLRVFTNERVSDRFFLGGNLAWGFGDKRAKFGAEADMLLYRPGEVRMNLTWSKDVEEAGVHRFLQTDSPFSSESYRRFMVDRMDYVQQYGSSFSLRFIRYFTGRLYFLHSDTKAGDDYIFLRNGDAKNSFRFTEAGLQLRFSYREKFMQTPKGTRFSMGTDFPVVWLNYGKGLGIMSGEYDYSRIEAGISQTFITRNLGRTSVMIEGGMVEGDVPLQKLYNNKGSFRGFSLEAANSFATMRMTEFASDVFISLFFRQNFESLIFRTVSFRPEMVFITNAGYGRLQDKEYHLNIPVRTLEKGYYESGFLVNNILKQLFMGYGIGVFYRYGPYSLSKAIDNFALKLTLNINLR